MTVAQSSTGVSVSSREAGSSESDTGGSDRNGERQPGQQSFWSSPTGWVTLGFLGVAGYYLITEHAAHLVGVLPWLLIAACPLMHLFMHHGHHRGAKPGREDKR